MEMLFKNQKKLQLRSDPSRSEYAICLEGFTDTLAATCENMSKRSQYTHLIEESNFLEDLQYDWKYTLKHWIDNRDHYVSSSNENVLHKELSSLLCPHIDEELINNKDYYNRRFKKDFDYRESRKENNAGLETDNINRHTGHRRTLPFKCHFCKLSFNGNTQRKKHELSWHPKSNTIITKEQFNGANRLITEDKENQDRTS
jgi:hypothetical protein